MVRVGSGADRAFLEQELALAIDEEMARAARPGDDADLAPYGVLGARTRSALRAQAVADVVRPAARLTFARYLA
jgi:hypothetical protein